MRSPKKEFCEDPTCPPTHSENSDEASYISVYTFFVLTGLPTLFPQEISIPVVVGVYLFSGTAQCQCKRFPVWTICVRNR